MRRENRWRWETGDGRLGTQMSSPTAALFIIHHSLFIILAILLAFTACTSATAAQTTASTPDSSPTPTLTPTAPPPPPEVTYTPVELGTVSPVIVQ